MKVSEKSENAVPSQGKVNDFRWLTKKSDKVKAKLGKVNGQVSDSHCKVRAEYLATSLTISDLGKLENGLLKVNKDFEQKQCIEKGGSSTL